MFHRVTRRWKRHWLLMYSPSGIHPLPLELWLSFTNRGYLNCYERGFARAFIIERVAPKDLEESSFDRLRHFYVNDDDNMMERVLQPILKLHLAYLKWYATVIFDYDLPLSALLNPPVAPRRVERVSDERKKLFRYGLVFKLWDRLRAWVPVMILGPGDDKVRTVVAIQLFKVKDGLLIDYAFGLMPLASVILLPEEE